MNSLHNIKKLNTKWEKIICSLWFMLLVVSLFFLASKIRNYSFVFYSLLLVTGWLSWTYTEYFFHRFIMHEASNAKGLGKLLNHKHHHSAPSDIRITTPHRIMMVAGSITSIALSVIFNNYFTILCGYFIGFTLFCLMHLVLHQEWSKKIFPKLHRYHIYHHCKYPDKCFGVTVTWWDRLFGTVPVKERETGKKILSFYYKQTGKRAS